MKYVWYLCVTKTLLSWNETVFSPIWNLKRPGFDRTFTNSLETCFQSQAWFQRTKTFWEFGAPVFVINWYFFKANHHVLKSVSTSIQVPLTFTKQQLRSCAEPCNRKLIRKHYWTIEIWTQGFWMLRFSAKFVLCNPSHRRRNHKMPESWYFVPIFTRVMEFCAEAVAR